MLARASFVVLKAATADDTWIWYRIGANEGVA